MRRVIQIDQFGESVGFTVTDGRSSHATFPGFVLTILMAVVVIFYGQSKYFALI